MMINWEVVLWTCITLAVIMGVIAMILTVISAVNMKKRRKQIGDLHTTLAVGSKVMFAGGIYGKVVRLGQEEIIDVEVAPKTIIQISRFAIQGIVE
ncbi:MAG: preprotein translocase subunit YajC [Oscillospiraceae bacterium]|nr:preprotein translocase subunit YajC [Oscillospiraceae bacterium]